MTQIYSPRKKPEVSQVERAGEETGSQIPWIHRSKETRVKGNPGVLLAALGILATGLTAYGAMQDNPTNTKVELQGVPNCVEHVYNDIRTNGEITSIDISGKANTLAELVQTAVKGEVSLKELELPGKFPYSIALDPGLIPEGRMMEREGILYKNMEYLQHHLEDEREGTLSLDLSNCKPGDFQNLLEKNGRLVYEGK